MNNNSKRTQFMIGAIMFIAYMILSFYNVISTGIPWVNIMFYLSCAAVGIGALAGIMYIAIAGAGIAAACELYWSFSIISYNAGYFDTYVMFSILYELLDGIAFILLLLAMIPYVSKSPSQSNLSKMGLFAGVASFFGAAPMVFDDIGWYFSSDGFFNLILTVLPVAGFFLLGSGLASQVKLPGFGKGGGAVPQTVPRSVPTAVPGSVPGQAPGYAAPVIPDVQPVQPVIPDVQPVQPVIPDVQPQPAAKPVIPDVQPQPAAKPEQPAPQKPAGTAENNLASLLQYKELLDAGIITEEEFNNMKKQILG